MGSLVIHQKEVWVIGLANRLLLTEAAIYIYKIVNIDLFAREVAVKNNN